MSEYLCPKCNAPNRDTARFCAVCGTPLLAGVSEQNRGVAPEGRSLSSASDNGLPAGFVLENRYKIEEQLGHGGFGAVYRAWDMRLSKPVAVKENIDISPDAQRQFTREATVLANLSHPNLPHVIDHFTIPDQGQYLAMDFVEGEDLLTLLNEQREISVEQSLEWLMQVADALDYLHSQDPPVVHRDIKPANIRITPRGKAMLVDFGLVKFSDPRKKTTSGARAMTPGYAPPEQYGLGQTDIRTDIYALGATTYKLITKVEPPESVQRLAGEHLAPANQVNPSISTQLNKTIDRAMALEPAKRFQKASELKNALNESLIAFKNRSGFSKPDELHTVVVDTSPGLLVKPTVAAPAAQPSVLPGVKNGKLSRRTGVYIGIGGIALFLVLCGIVIAAVFVNGDHKPTPTEIPATQIVSTQPETGNVTATIQPAMTTQAMITTEAALDLTSTAQFKDEATQQARESYLASISAGKTVVFGPRSGRILHREDGTVKTLSAGLGLRNFAVEVKFVNPYAPSTNGWDYGLMFRYADSRQQFRLSILSDRSWAFVNYIGNPTGILMDEGIIPDLDIREGGSNHIRLIASEDSGWFFVNGEFISELDLSSQYSGGILIATGFYKGNQVTGKLTEYQDFTVWSLP